MLHWQRALECRRPSYYATDPAGRRLYVEQTVRSECASGLIGSEFQISIGGVRQGEIRLAAPGNVKDAFLAAEGYLGTSKDG